MNSFPLRGFGSRVSRILALLVLCILNPSPAPGKDAPPQPTVERLKALEAEIRTTHDSAVGDPIAGKRSQLEEQFRGAVQRKIETAKGPLKIKLEAELGRLNRGEELPAADADKAHPGLSKLRGTWHRELAKIEAERDALAKEFWKPWRGALGDLEQDYQKSGDTRSTAAVASLRDRLQTEFTGESPPADSPQETSKPKAEPPSSRPDPPAGESFVLFDGNSLKGWTASGNSRAFSVDDGAIKATDGVAYLFYTADVYYGGRFRDFDLTAQVKTRGEANAGIYFHTATADGLAPKGGIGVKIHNGTLSPNKTGGILELAPYDKVTVADGEWFDLEISVRQNFVITRANGKDIVRHQAKGSFDGTFALQCGLPKKGATWFRKIKVQTYEDPLTALCGLPPGKAFERTIPDLKELPSGKLNRFGFDEKGNALDDKLPSISDFVSVVVAGDQWVGLRSNGTTRSSNPEWENSARERIGRLFDAGTAAAVTRDGTPFLGRPGYLGPHLDPERLYDWAHGYNSGLALDIDGRVDGSIYNPGGDPGLLHPPLGPTDIIDLAAIGIHFYALRAGGQVLLIGTRSGPMVPEVPADAKIVELAGGSNGPQILARAEDGRVFVIRGDRHNFKHEMPEGLRARKVRVGPGICAAQREDGTWIAWGNDKQGVVSKINGFGPKVVDLAPSERAVYWIEDH